MTRKKIVMVFGRLDDTAREFEPIYVERNPLIIADVLNHLERRFDANGEGSQPSPGTEQRKRRNV